MWVLRLVISTFFFASFLVASRARYFSFVRFGCAKKHQVIIMLIPNIWSSGDGIHTAASFFFMILWCVYGLHPTRHATHKWEHAIEHLLPVCVIRRRNLCEPYHASLGIRVFKWLFLLYTYCDGTPTIPTYSNSVFAFAGVSGVERAI